MKTHKSITAMAALAIAIVAWGCSESKLDTAPSTTQSTTGASAPESSESSKGASLGTEKSNEHFAMTLSSEPAELKVGKAKFVAKVLHHGQPTEGATVTVSLSMPSMNMGGPEITLKHTSNGVYEGDADLSMGGDWQAKISVEQEGHPGEAIYDFVVME